MCLEDIGRAQLMGSCPEKLLPKIQLRRAECLLSLGRLQEAADALRRVQESLSAEQRPEAARHRALLGRLEQLRDGGGEESGALHRPPAAPGQAPPDPEPWEESSHVSGASVAVSLHFSSCKGRHLVAAEDLPPGKLLVREAAFASVLCPGESLLLEGTAQALQDGRLANPDLHCHHCLRPLLASVPCRGCSYSRYCGPGCAQLAWSSYHWAECALGGLLLALGVFCHMALRTVLVAGFAQVKALVTQPQEGDAPIAVAAAEQGARPIPGCEADGRYSGSYRAIFSLLPHTDRHSPGLRFLFGLSVAALCKALEEDAGLEAWIVEGAAEEEEEADAPAGLEILGEAMLRHVLQLQCNGQAVTALRPSGQWRWPCRGWVGPCHPSAERPGVQVSEGSCVSSERLGLQLFSLPPRARRRAGGRQRAGAPGHGPLPGPQSVEPLLRPQHQRGFHRPHGRGQGPAPDSSRAGAPSLLW